MASKKQIESNRRNAKKSTGPRTPNGKTIASRNSIKHGLYARDIIIDSPHLREDASEYKNLLESLIEELKPTTLFQESLVIKIANCLWRSRRAIIAESSQIFRQLDYLGPDRYKDSLIKILQRDDIHEEPPDPSELEEAKEHAALIGVKSIPNQDFSMNLLRYEMRLDRQLTRAYKLLRHLQSIENSVGRNPCGFDDSSMEKTVSPDSPPDTKNMQNEPNPVEPDDPLLFITD